MASLIRRRSKATSMSLLQAPSPALLKILMNCLNNLGNAVQLDHRLVEFNDTKYRIRSSEAGYLEISISIPIFSQGQQPISILNLPLAVTEAVKASYGHVMQIIENPEQGFNLTVNIDLSKFPSDKEGRWKLLTKVASLRAFMLGEQTREICKHMFSMKSPNPEQLIFLALHPKQNLFIFPLLEKVMLVLPIQFSETTEAVLGGCFLQKFMEVCNTSRSDKPPAVLWSQMPPTEITSVRFDVANANAGFLSFAIHPHHVDGNKLDRIVWSISSFYEYMQSHIKRSKGFMQNVMRRHVDNLIQVLNQTRLHSEEAKTTKRGSLRLAHLLQRITLLKLMLLLEFT